MDVVRRAARMASRAWVPSGARAGLRARAALGPRVAFGALAVASALAMVGALAGCAGPDDQEPAAPEPGSASPVPGGGPAGRASGTMGPRPSGPVGRPAESGAPGTATGAPPAAPGSPPRITVRRTGGIAGVFHTLVVRPDGVWSYTDARGAPNPGTGPSQGRLSPAQRAELARLAKAPTLAAEANRRPGPPGCADGFQYAVTVGSTTVSWTDCGADGPPAATAIKDFLARATPL